MVSQEPKKRKLLNDKTAFSLSPAVAAAQADKPAAVAAAGAKKPISSLRELFKNGNLKIPKLCVVFRFLCVDLSGY